MKNVLSLKNIALNYLCAYAIFYPLAAHVLMNHADGAKGTFSVQILQALMILATAILWRYRVRVRSLLGYVDAWTLGTIYFLAEAVCFALYHSRGDALVELVFAARFLVWFVFAIFFSRVNFTTSYLRRLTFSFWLGTLVQIVVAFGSRFSGDFTSTYREVVATTGSSEVSGKTAATFVALGCVLSIYRFFTKKNWRKLYGVVALLGFGVVLMSYNRATQLALVVAAFYSWACFAKKGYRRAAFAVLGFVFVAGIFFSTTYGTQYLTRWRNISEDGGSGRVLLAEVALDRFANPSSASSFLFGRGMIRMERLVYEAIGNKIGMHNDFLDLLTSYGFFGGAFYLWIAWTLWSFPNSLDSRSLERILIKSTTLFVLSTGLFTGIFQATYALVMLIVVQHYFYRLGCEKELALKSENFGDALGFDDDNDDDNDDEDGEEDADERKDDFEEENEEREEGEFGFRAVARTERDLWGRGRAIDVDDR